VSSYEDNGSGLPFVFRNGVDLELNKSGRISASSLAKMIEKGEFSSQQEHMLCALKSFSLMTARQLEMLFYVSNMPLRYMRLSSGLGRNLHRKDISYLMRYGILDQYEMKSGNKKVAPGLYAAAGAVYQQKALQEIVPVERMVVAGGRNNARIRPASCLNYPIALSVLALNQLHIRVLTDFSFLPTAYRAWLTPDVPANIFQTHDNQYIIAVAPREKPGKRAVEVIINAAIAELCEADYEEAQKKILFVVGSTAYALELNGCLPEEIREQCLYITDYEIYGGHGLDQLIKVTGAREFDLIAGMEKDG